MLKRTRTSACRTTTSVIVGAIALLLGCGEGAGGGGICGNLLCEEGERGSCGDCDNLPASVCGDGLCQNGETSVSCGRDCAALSELFGDWLVCDPFGEHEDPAEACANAEFELATRIDADGVLTNPGYGDPCTRSSIEEVAGVIEARSCEPRAWSRTRALATRTGPYLSFYHPAEDSFIHHEPNPTPDTVPVSRCEDVEGGIVDARCDALPRVTPGVRAALVGAWQKCEHNSDEPDAAAACALGVRDEFLMLTADGVATMGCAMLDAEVSETEYTLRTCGWLGTSEYGLRGSVLLSSDASGEYLRMDDPFQTVGFDHYVRVELAVAEAAVAGCPSLPDLRCGQRAP